MGATGSARSSQALRQAQDGTQYTAQGTLRMDTGVWERGVVALGPKACHGVRCDRCFFPVFGMGSIGPQTRRGACMEGRE